MSTVVSYLMALIVQFIGLSLSPQEESISLSIHSQCEETADHTLPSIWSVPIEPLLQIRK